MGEGAGWSQVAVLRPGEGDAGTGSNFGIRAVVAGDRIVVGAYLDAIHGRNSGAAYVFRRTAGAWEEEVRLDPEDAGPSMQFGSAVAIQDSRIAVGAIASQTHNHDGVYLFEQTDSGWRQKQKLSTQGMSIQGLAAAFAGTLLAVGAEFASNGRGAVIQYRESNSAWAESSVLSAPDGAAYDAFGTALALREGSLASSVEHMYGNLANPGAVYLYDLGLPATSPPTRLDATSPGLNGFGHSLAFAGSRLVIGAVPDTDDPGHVFISGTDGARIEISPDDRGPSDWFGRYIAATPSRIVVGSPKHAHASVATGAAYVFSER